MHAVLYMGKRLFAPSTLPSPSRPTKSRGRRFRQGTSRFVFMLFYFFVFFFSLSPAAADPILDTGRRLRTKVTYTIKAKQKKNIRNNYFFFSRKPAIHTNYNIANSVY